MKELPKNTSEALVLFFRDPQEEEEPVYYSILYLLRRDIFKGFGFNPSNGCKPLCDDARTIWLSMMGIMAGIDLLGKFVEGRDDVGSSGKRFKDYMRRYFHIEDSDCIETIYQLRNSLLHSFGWYSAKRNKQGELVKEYRFTLNMEYGAPLITKVGDNVYVVSVSTLHKLFETSVGEYSDALVDNELTHNFDNMFPRYGWMRIGPRQ